MDTFLTAVALVLILEGLLPFLAPSQWRKIFTEVAQLADGQIRFMGFGALLLGLLLLLI